MSGAGGDMGGPCPEGLLCAIAFDPTSLPRNRYYWLYSEARARRAHGRAYALRRLHEQLAVFLKHSRVAFTVEREDRGVRIAYRDDGLAMIRRVHLGGLEASILRMLLDRDDVEVPKALRVGVEDRLRVAAALERIRAYPGLPDPSGWSDVLAPLAPAAAPSNTTE